MPKFSSTYSYTVVIIFALFVSACSSLTRPESDKGSETSRQQAPLKTSLPKDRLYEVGEGDTLSEIALKNTGDALNWRKIAELNNISNPNTIRKGQIIIIPHALMPTVTSPPAADLKSEPDSSDEKPLDTQANKGEPQAQDIEPSRAEDQAQAALAPLPDLKKPAQQEKVGGWLIIRGTYYPREINIGPDSSSDILTQAWPGTRMQFVDRADGWYKVITDKGHGFLNPAYATVYP